MSLKDVETAVNQTRRRWSAGGGQLVIIFFHHSPQDVPICPHLCSVG